jgi:hypothetical protein
MKDANFYCSEEAIGSQATSESCLDLDLFLSKTCVQYGESLFRLLKRQ